MSPHPNDDAGRAGEGEPVALLVEDGGEIVFDLLEVTEADVRAGFDVVTAHPDASLADSGYLHRGVAQQSGGAVAVQRLAVRAREIAGAASDAGRE